MATKKKPLKMKQLKEEINKDLIFIKSIFSALSTGVQTKGEEMDIVEINGQNGEGPKSTNRARSIAELEEKLQKVKSEKNFNIKSKLAKKSIVSKLNKKIKKNERINKFKVKTAAENYVKQKTEKENKVNVAKPVFNNEGKVVFSKFDFANVGTKGFANKSTKDPKKLLENLKKQEDNYRQLEQSENSDKVKEIKEKAAWKNTLQKAEGQKIKDDPILLKKSIKKMEQKKKVSKKQWDDRIKTVVQKKENQQKRRKENIAKKKKEKKSKIVKAAVKRGRVVI